MNMSEGFDVYSVTRSMRVMGPHERARFGPDAWGHLVSLSRSGLMSTVDFEHLIERALLQIDGRITLTDLRSLLADSGLDDGGDAEQQITVH